MKIDPQSIIAMVIELSDLDIGQELNPESPLIGSDTSFDSMGLVQLCLSLEEKANELGFDFDWTSEKAMSSINSIFRSPQSLANEFNRQLEEKK